MAASYLLLLSGPLSTLHAVESIFTPPARLPLGESAAADDDDSDYDADNEADKDDENARPNQVVHVSREQHDTINEWIKEHAPGFEPVWIRTSSAVVNAPARRLTREEMLARRGVDLSLPQNRSNTTEKALEYPIWYFFYGTLQDPRHLASILRIPLSQLPALTPARMSGFTMKRWRQYKAAVEGPTEETVEGMACRVESEVHAMRLAGYETSAYEEVETEIWLGDGRVERGTMVTGRSFVAAGGRWLSDVGMEWRCGVMIGCGAWEEFAQARGAFMVSAGWVIHFLVFFNDRPRD